jgi:hypothetical protein
VVNKSNIQSKTPSSVTSLRDNMFLQTITNEKVTPLACFYLYYPKVAYTAYSLCCVLNGTVSYLPSNQM